jgi:hypothetical protein
MKRQRKKDLAVHKDLTPFESLELQRRQQEQADHRRYVIQRVLGIIRTIALIGLGIWGYMTRDTIREFIINFFTNPKLKF